MSRRWMLRTLFSVLFLSALLGISSLTGERLLADAPTHSVSFNASFDDDNIGTPYLVDHPYNDRIGFASSITALEDYTFAFFIVNGHVRFDLEPDHMFIVNGEMEIEAVFSGDEKYAVVFMDTNGEIIKLEYVDENANAIPPGEELWPTKPGFVVDALLPWVGDTDNVNEHRVLILRYTIDSSETFTIDVTGGTGEGTYLYNTIVSVEADTENPHGTFSHWEEGGIPVSYNQIYRFTAMRPRALEAIFAAEPLDLLPVVIMSDNLEIRSDHASYLGQFALPPGHTLIEYGILRSNTNATPKCGDGDVIRHRGEKHVGATGEFLMSFGTPMVYQRAYVVSEDDESQLHYTYSPVVETTNYSIALTANHVDAVVGVVEDPPYFHGDIVTITASAVPGYDFLHWFDLDTGMIFSTEDTHTFPVEKDYNLDARYRDENIIFHVDFTGYDGTPPSGWTINLTYPNGYPRMVNYGDSIESEAFATMSTFRIVIEYTTYNIPSASSNHQMNIYLGGTMVHIFNLQPGTVTFNQTVTTGASGTRIKIEFLDWYYSNAVVDIRSITLLHP